LEGQKANVLPEPEENFENLDGNRGKFHFLGHPSCNSSHFPAFWRGAGLGTLGYVLEPPCYALAL